MRLTRLDTELKYTYTRGPNQEESSWSRIVWRAQDIGIARTGVIRDGWQASGSWFQPLNVGSITIAELGIQEGL